MQWLAQTADTARWVVGIQEGTLVLAASQVLNGVEAACPPAATSEQAPKVQQKKRQMWDRYKAENRHVEWRSQDSHHGAISDNKFVTCAACLQPAAKVCLEIIASLAGQDCAQVALVLMLWSVSAKLRGCAQQNNTLTHWHSKSIRQSNNVADHALSFCTPITHFLSSSKQQR
jgi:transcriptional regulator GlxA family with amidase domain